MPTVQNAVATKVKVSLGASLFISVATAVTFSIGGAMLAGFLPSPSLSTVCYKEATSTTLFSDSSMTTVATGECGIVRPVTDKPLSITDLKNVNSLVSMHDTQMYNFQSGDQNFGSWNTYFYSDGSTSVAAMPLSIAISTAIGGAPVAANVILIDTNLGTLNVCLPEVVTQKTVYVGISGTVYDDAVLTKKSTTQACATLLARAATPTSITAGSRLLKGSTIMLGREAVMNSSLGSFSDYSFYPSSTTVLAGSKAPLRLTHAPGWSSTYPYTVPADVLTLTTDIGTLNLCFPSQTYANALDRRDLFASTDGSLYTDALLTKRAMTETCESILDRAFTPTTVTAASVSTTAFTNWNLHFLRGQFMELGILFGYGVFHNYNQADPSLQTPLILRYQGNIYNPEFANLPEHTVTAVTNLGTKEICSPAITIELGSNGNGAPVDLFVDKNGSTFYDAHLQMTAKACAPTEKVPDVIE